MLQEQIDVDLRDAMRAKDEIRLSTLRLLKSAVTYAGIAKNTEKMDDVEIVKVIQREVKKREEAIENYVKGARPELAEKEKKELAILQSYLPAQIPEEELARIVEQAVAKTGASTKAQMGMVIKEVMAEVQGRADGKRISALVSRKLR